LLIDSGSSGLFVVARVARKRGFETLAEETVFGGGGDRRHPSRRGLFPTFELGELAFRDALATTVDQEIDPAGRYQGVIGLSVFDGYRVTIDLQRARLILDRARPPMDGTRYWTFSGQMLVQAAARGAGRGLFLLDTGSTTSVLNRSYADAIPRVAVVEGARVHTVGGWIEGAARVRGTSLLFQGLDTGGGELLAIDLSLRSRLCGVEISGYLGLDLLGGRRLVVDTVARRVRVELKE
jgi:hypothetical protein